MRVSVGALCSVRLMSLSSLPEQARAAATPGTTVSARREALGREGHRRGTLDPYIQVARPGQFSENTGFARLFVGRAASENERQGRQVGGHVAELAGIEIGEVAEPCLDVREQT